MTGTHVRQKNMAPSRAKQKARAMGLNILPSTPVSDNTGMKTIMMMSCPKMADLSIFTLLS